MLFQQTIPSVHPEKNSGYCHLRQTTHPDQQTHLSLSQQRVCNSQAAMILLYSLVLGVQAGVGCDIGMFGERCDQNCPPSCAPYPGENARKCEKATGSCAVGCIPGWYGDYCNHTCSRNCKDKICNQPDGLCSIGCAGKYIGDFCNKEIVPDNQCPPGQFGDACGRICPPQCDVGCGQDVSICERDTGKCHDGCRPGWHGDHCNLTSLDLCKDYFSRVNHTSDQDNCDQVSMRNKADMLTVCIIMNACLLVIVLVMFLQRRRVGWRLCDLCRNQEHSENPVKKDRSPATFACSPDKEREIFLPGLYGVKIVTEKDRLDIDAYREIPPTKLSMDTYRMDLHKARGADECCETDDEGHLRGHHHAGVILADIS